MGTTSSWPPQCCVPAFLLRAVVSLSGQDIGDLEHMRMGTAIALGVRVAPRDRNPWNLPVAADAAAWGVTPTAALRRFPRLTELLGLRRSVQLEILPLASIAFEQFEEAIRARSCGGAVVGLGLDCATLGELTGRRVPDDRARHVVRLSPLPGDDMRNPTILDDRFDFGYRGTIRFFDDSGEFAADECVAPWQDVLDASRRADGAIWSVELQTSQCGQAR